MNEPVDYPYGRSPPMAIIDEPADIADAAAPHAWLATALVFGFLLVDFLVAPLMYAHGPSEFGFFLVPISLGAIAAQVGVLSSWLVWGEQPFFWRLLIHWGIVAVCCWVWIAGLATCARGTDLMTGHCIVALGMALVSAAMQAPLWATRQIFAWRFVQPGTAAAARPEKASSVGNLMLATSIAAVALGFARILPTDGSEEAAWAWLFTLGFAALVGLFGILPIALFLLWQRNIGTGLLLTFLFTLIVIGSIWLGVFAVNWQMLGIMSGIIASFAFFLTMSALAARGFGIRLMLGRTSRQPKSAAHLV